MMTVRDSRYEDGPSEALMGSGRKRLMRDLLRKILLDALMFWENQRVIVDLGFRNLVESVGEIQELAPLFYFDKKIGKRDGRDFKMRDASPPNPYKSVIWKQMKPGTRERAKLIKNRLQAGKVVSEVLRSYRHATSHEWDPHSACLAGSLLLLIDNAGDLDEEQSKAAYRLREKAAITLKECLLVYEPGEKEENGATPHAPEESAAGAALDIRDVVEDAVARGVEAVLATRGSAATGKDVSSDLEAIESSLKELNRLVDRAVTQEMKAASASADSVPMVADGQAVGRALRDMQADVRKLADRGLEESDLRYLISLVKQARDAPAFEGMTALKSQVDALMHMLTEKGTMHAIVMRGAKDVLADMKIESVLHDMRSELGKLSARDSGSSGNVIDANDVAQKIAAALSEFQPEALPSRHSDEVSQPLLTLPEEAPLVDDEPIFEATDLLTPQQAENRLVLLRNRIVSEMGIEWYHCVLQRKFIAQMIRERIVTAASWLEAEHTVGAIGNWFSDPRNRHKREEVEEQFQRYGDEMFDIMKSIMYDAEVAEVVDDDDIPF